MKNHLFILLCCTVVMMGGITLLFSGSSQQTMAYHRADSCDESLTWRIGRIDPRYDIRKSTIKKLMAEVSDLWSGAAGKELLQYSDSGEVAIHFIYTKEQEFTESEQQLTRRIERERAQYDTMKQDFQQFSDKYDTQLQQYNDVVTEYNQTVNRYDQLITKWNAQGGVPKKEEEQMKRKVKQLRAKIQEEEQRLKALGDNVNNISDRLNNQADHINALIYHYNDRFSKRREFHQGRYIHVGGDRKINIYQFENIDKLRLVLAHEVGHALGLSHVQNPRSIMFYIMKEQDAANLSLSPQDVEALQNQCGEQS